MNTSSQPGTPRAVMIYDGECAFCRDWIARWQRLTGDRVTYAPYQEVAGCYPQISRQEFAEAVYLIEPDGEVYKGAQAVFRSLAVRPALRWLMWSYRRMPGFAPLSEGAYRWVSHHRHVLGPLSRRLTGTPRRKAF